MSKSQFILDHRDHLIRRVLAKNPLLRFKAPANSNRRIDICDLFSSPEQDDDGSVSAEDFFRDLMKNKRAEIVLPHKNNVGERIKKINAESDDVRRTTGLSSLFFAWPFVRVPRLNANPLSAPLFFWRIQKIKVKDRKNLTVEMPDDEEPECNFILKEWLKIKEGLSLDFPSIITEEQGEDFTTIIKNISSIVAKWEGYENNLSEDTPYYLQKYDDSKEGAILPCAVIGVAYFKYLTLLRDLDALVEKSDGDCGLLDEFLGRPSDAVRNPPRCEIPEESDKYLVEQTDASQEQAVWQARESKIMLLKGPPGTGKSQTIVNLIGDALKRNESVALVCRKPSALDVVKKRLTDAGLGHLAVSIVEPRKQRWSIINELRAIKDGAREIDGGVIENTQGRAGCNEKVVSLEDGCENISKSRGESENYSIYGHLRGTMARIAKDTQFDPYCDRHHEKFARSVFDAIKADFVLEDEKEKLKKFTEDCKRCDYANNRWRDANVDKNHAADITRSFNMLVEEARRLDKQSKDLPDEQFRDFLFNRMMRNFAIQLFLDSPKRDAVDAMAQLVKYTEGAFARARMPSYEPIWNSVYHGEGAEAYKRYAVDMQHLPLIASINERKTSIIRAFMERDGSNWDMKYWADIVHAIYCYAKWEDLPKAYLDEVEEEQNRANLRKAIKEKRFHDSESIRLVFMYRKQAAKTLYDNRLLRLKGRPSKGVRPSTIRNICHHGWNELSEIYPALLMNPDSMCQILPLETGIVDLAIVDEASQMFLADAMPILYRAKKIVVSGDNMQMPPDEIFALQENEEYEDEDEEVSIEETSIPITYELLEATDALVESGDVHCRLNVHYRSRPAELIAFSNHAFYDGKLQAAPDNGNLRSPLCSPIEVVPVPGKFKKGINNEEIEEIVNQLRRIWSVSNPPSVGVIVFNVKQEKMLKKRLETECEKDKKFATMHKKSQSRHLEKEGEEDRDTDTKHKESQNHQDDNGGEDAGFFVRSVEHVQGDERDVIILGTTYNNEGNYGLLSHAEKGRRRLNVAVTRAKHGMIVVTSLTIDNISHDGERPGGNERGGAEHWYLWKFMEYARAVSNGKREDTAKILRSINSDYIKPLPLGRGPDSQFEIDIADYIRELGYVVDYQIGESGFRIDLGVKHIKEERYLCGIECDGRIWHEGWRARHNDAWRQEILESKGWNIYRIWSDHWYDRPDDTKKKLCDYLKERVSNQHYSRTDAK